MAGKTLHEVRPDAFNYVLDNSIAPALEIDSGDDVELHVRDASDEQITADSGVDAVAGLDFSHVNPVSGPVFVKGARPGDVLAVDILEPGEHSVVPPSNWGGTVDVKPLRPGTPLFLPVGVEGALFSVGDTHAAMGDGEVCGTAVEAAMDIVVRLSVRRDMQVEAPQYRVAAGELARTDAGAYHVTTGVDPDLMEAARAATRAMIGNLGQRYGLEL